MASTAKRQTTKFSFKYSAVAVEEKQRRTKQRQ